MYIKVSTLLVALVLAATALAGDSTYRHSEEPIGTVREVYDGRLYPDIQVNTFRNIDRLFPTRVVKRGETVYPLPVSDHPLEAFSYTVDGESYDLYDVLSLNRVSGLLIIHDGEIQFEKYLLGNDEQTRWMSMSVVKSMTAALIGAAIQDGLISGIDDPIVDYLPRFKGTAYDGVTVRNLLQMTSGVERNLHGPGIRPPSYAGCPDCPATRRDPGPDGRAAARRRTRNAMELQHRRDARRRRTGPGRDRDSGRRLPV